MARKLFNRLTQDVFGPDPVAGARRLAVDAASPLVRQAARNVVRNITGHAVAGLQNAGRRLMISRTRGAYFSGVPTRRRPGINFVRRYRGYTPRGRVRRGRYRYSNVRRRLRRSVARLRRLARGKRVRKITTQGGQARMATNNVRIRYKMPRSVRVRLGRSRRRRGWYRLGRWWLTGAYAANRLTPNSATQRSRNAALDAYSPIQFTTTTEADWQTLGFYDEIYHVNGNSGPINDNGISNSFYWDSVAHFNVTYTYNSQTLFNTDANEGLNSVAASSSSLALWYRPLPRWTKGTMIQFYYGPADDATYSQWLGSDWTAQVTQCRVPRVPLRRAEWYTNNTQNALSGWNSTYPTTDVINTQRLVPYSCRWSYVYAQFHYSIKVRWPEVWSVLWENSLINSTSPGLTPNNPPLYVRLIGIRYMTDEYCTYQLLPRYLFPVNGNIKSRIRQNGRSGLWSDYRGIVFFEKTFSFNGQLVPKSTGAENLLDGQEGVFTVRCPFKTSNNYVVSIPTTDVPSQFWPSVKQGRICFYCYAAFDTSMAIFAKNVEETATIGEFYQRYSPSCSVNFQPVYYCYPMLKAPTIRFISSSSFDSLRSAASLMSLSPITGELVPLKQANDEYKLDKVTIAAKKKQYEVEKEKKLSEEAPESAHLETHDSEVLSPDQTAATDSSLPLKE